MNRGRKTGTKVSSTTPSGGSGQYRKKTASEQRYSLLSVAVDALWAAASSSYCQDFSITMQCTLELWAKANSCFLKSFLMVFCCYSEKKNNTVSVFHSLCKTMFHCNKCNLLLVVTFRQVWGILPLTFRYTFVWIFLVHFFMHKESWGANLRLFKLLSYVPSPNFLKYSFNWNRITPLPPPFSLSNSSHEPHSHW